MKIKRNRSTSAESAVKAMVDASMGPPAVPGHVKLRSGDMEFWNGIMRSRAYDEWTETDLVVAAQLARCQRDIEVETELMEAEKKALQPDEVPPINPRVGVVDQLSRREMALMRTLRMGGRVAGDSRDEAGRRLAQRRAEKVQKELAGEELLAV